ncbi:MAG: HIT family protein [Bacteroidota bacterium]|nr:HIT family protein [Bacteroidota bacterium]|tara:strand:+ start:1954 stop:2349 length:396 start_codon:yes stop_codon:yes gene_type:complete
MTDSIFTKIIKGEIPCHKIEENEHFIAFLDIMPLKKGHTLVVPKVQVDYIFDLENQTLGDLMIFAKKVAKKIEAAIPCERIGVAVIGLEVPHAHVHLIPLVGISDIDFSQPKLNLSQQELKEVALQINAVK